MFGIVYRTQSQARCVWTPALDVTQPMRGRASHSAWVNCVSTVQYNPLANIHSDYRTSSAWPLLIVKFS